MLQDKNYALELKNITKSFGPVRVLNNVSLSLPKGTILGLVGENGAGKSTLMNILGGIYKRDSGEIYLDGKPFEPIDPKASQAAGIAFIHQELNLFTNLTVAENLFILDMPKSGFLKSVDYKLMNTIAKEKLTKLGIADIDPFIIVKDLPLGKRQVVEITKAIIHDARIIILDEPTTSLSASEKEKLFGVMHELQNQGKSIIFISHILEDVFANCDEIVVLRDGQVITQSPAKMLSQQDVIKMMVGRELNKIYPLSEKNIGDVVFESRDISKEGKLDCVNLSLKEGEVVGLFGLMGAGRTEYLRCIFGVDPIDEGSVLFHEKKIFPLTPENCVKNNIAFITENRREEGLLLPKTVRENIVLTILEKLTKGLFGFLDFQEEGKMAHYIVKELNIKTVNENKQVVNELSGGNQQKVVFGKWVIRKPKVFLLDEPTRGIDVGAKQEIYKIINSLAADGSAILMVSSEMEELIGMCDRILVMSQGKITGEFFKENGYSQEKIIAAALGGENNGVSTTQSKSS